MALGATGFQPPWDSGTKPPCSQGRGVLPLRPAWASWMPGTVPWLKRNFAMRERKAMCSSFQMPRSCGLMRPSEETAQASVKMREAPPTARLPRWTRCQSLAKPSVLEYWHMGETTMRLRRRTSRICNSSNRFMGDWMMDVGEKWQEKRVDWCWRVRAGAAEATPKDYRSGHTLRSRTAGSQAESRCGAIQRKAKDLTQRAQRKTGEHRER